MFNKRSMPEIILEILQTEGKRKTHIMYRTALTYPQLTRYLDVLMDRGLIEKKADGSGGEVFKVTDRGHDLSKHLSLATSYLGLGDYDEKTA